MRLRQSFLCVFFLAFSVCRLFSQESLATILNALMQEFPQIESWSYQIRNGSREVDRRWAIVYLGFSLEQDAQTVRETKNDVFYRLHELGHENIQVVSEYRWTTSIRLPKNQDKPWEIKYENAMMELAYQYSLQPGNENMDAIMNIPDDAEHIRLNFYFSIRDKPSEAWRSELTTTIVLPLEGFIFTIEQ